MQRITIVMPSLNVAKYMKQCLDSVVNQTLTDIEILCVDAGSTDGTLEIIKEYAKKDSRIKLIMSDKKSYGYQMNLGIDAAQGEYIGIVETDDYIDHDMFESYYKKISESGVDFVKGGYTGFIGEEKTQEREYFDITDDSLLDNVIDLRSNRDWGMLAPVHIWSGIYSKKFLEEKGIRFNETPGASYQDTSFSILVGMLADSCIYTQDCFYHYRMDNAGSSVKSQGKITCVIDEYRYIYDELEKRFGDITEYRKIIDRYKLHTYDYNYRRLNKAGREEFLGHIREEIEEYNNHIYIDEFTDAEQELIEKLSRPDRIDFYIEQEDALRLRVDSIVENVLAGVRYNVVGAGRYYTMFSTLEEIIGCEFIKSVSDNSKKIQGEKLGRHIILSVEAAVNDNLGEKFIVANRYHAQDILQQLLGLGVKQEDIMVIDKMIGFEEMAKYVRQ